MKQKHSQYQKLSKAAPKKALGQFYLMDIKLLRYLELLKSMYCCSDYITQPNSAYPKKLIQNLVLGYIDI